jgi:ribosomal protein S18 acetylase RimI-like enzyme
MEVRTHSGACDIEVLAATLGSAFADDPLMLFLHKPGVMDVEKRNVALYGAVLTAELSRPKGQVVVHVSADGDCVALWNEVGCWKLSPGVTLKYVRGCVRAFGWRRLPRALSILNQIEKKHPTKPHLYLHVLGTAAGSQGKGLGSVVISKMLTRCDEEGLDAYLESSNLQNVRFYERHGFEITEQPMKGLPAGAPPVTAMWRKARSAKSSED